MEANYLFDNTEYWLYCRFAFGVELSPYIGFQTGGLRIGRLSQRRCHKTLFQRRGIILLANSNVEIDAFWFNTFGVVVVTTSLVPLPDYAFKSQKRSKKEPTKS